MVAEVRIVEDESLASAADWTELVEDESASVDWMATRSGAALVAEGCATRRTTWSGAALVAEGCVTQRRAVVMLQRGCKMSAAKQTELQPTISDALSKNKHL